MSEIQEAAKRVLSWAEDRCMLNPMSPMEIENKICAVAEAYLAEPITEEWLREIGFYPGKMPRDLVFGPVVRGIGQSPNSYAGAYWIVRTYMIPRTKQPETRGDLRRLLRALGITSKEESDGQ